MADEIYKVRDPEGNVREIKGPAGASDEDIIQEAKRLFLTHGVRGMAGGPMGLALGINQAAQEMLPKFAYKAGGAVTDATGSPGAGYAANVAAQALPVLAGGGVARLAGPALEKGAKSLMQSAIKPGIADLETGKATRAIDTLLKEGISPNKGGIEKLRAMSAALDAEISQAIASSTATVSKSEVGKRLIGTWDRFKNQVDADADLDTIKKAWMAFRNHIDLAGKSDIPVQLAHELKKGTYARLNEKAFGEVGTASKESQKALARGLKEEVGMAVPETVAPMAQQADLMNAAQVAGRRALMEGNKNPVGLAPISASPAGFVGFLADRSAALKALLARGLYSGQKAIPENAARLAAMLGVAPQSTEE